MIRIYLLLSRSCDDSMRCRKSILQCFVLIWVAVVTFAATALFKRTAFTTTTQRSSQMVLSVVPRGHVTKSLSQLGKMDEVNRHFLFLNNVPKCGAEVLILLLQRLQGANNFRHVRLKWGNRRHLSRMQQERLVDEIYVILKTGAVPLSFDRHVYFINFNKFDKQLPTYINLIRNPVDKIISRTSYKNNTSQDFYYKCLLSKKNNCNFKNGKPYDMSIPYFCGHDPRCMLLNNKWALQTAKTNIERYYPLVGVLEELNATLEVLERKIPYFFRGVRDVYRKDFLRMYENNHITIAPSKVRQRLRDTLVTEMEFYEWVKSRLLKQFHRVS